jgi:signal transduction histidine kinase
VTVRVTRGPHAIVVEAANLLGDRPGSRPQGGGRGLAGMADRVRLLRGDLEAGAVRGPDGAAWRVRARFPLP